MLILIFSFNKALDHCLLSVTTFVLTVSNVLLFTNFEFCFGFYYFSKKQTSSRYCYAANRIFTSYSYEEDAAIKTSVLHNSAYIFSKRFNSIRCCFNKIVFEF